MNVLVAGCARACRVRSPAQVGTDQAKNRKAAEETESTGAVLSTRASQRRRSGSHQHTPARYQLASRMMIELGPATEDEMVLAFLRAEVDSSRFGALFQEWFAQLKERLGLDRELLLNAADLRSVQHNALRKNILRTARGYGDGQLHHRAVLAWITDRWFCS